MRYTLEIEIARSREKVVALFVDQENMPDWQSTLISLEHLNGVPGHEGAKTKLLHRFGRRQVELIETVEAKNLPDEVTNVYEAKGAWNRVINHFVEMSPNQTRWIFDSEFKCGGLLRAMAFLMPGMFKKASLKDLQSFKAFAENSA